MAQQFKSRRVLRRFGPDLEKIVPLEGRKIHVSRIPFRTRLFLQMETLSVKNSTKSGQGPWPFSIFIRLLVHRRSACIFFHTGKASKVRFFHPSNEARNVAFHDEPMGASGIDVVHLHPAVARHRNARMASNQDPKTYHRIRRLLEGVTFIRDGKQFAQKFQRNGFAAFQFVEFQLSFVTSAKILGVLAISIVIPFEFGTKGHHNKRSLRDPGFHGFFVDCHPSARSHAS